jgi:hypothetical protein
MIELIGKILSGTIYRHIMAVFIVLLQRFFEAEN